MAAVLVDLLHDHLHVEGICQRIGSILSYGALMRSEWSHHAMGALRFMIGLNIAFCYE